MRRTAYSIHRTGMARMTEEKLQAANDLRYSRKVEPSQPAMGPNSTFVYVRHEATDIRKTFERVRKERSTVF